VCECVPLRREVYDRASPGYTGRCTAPLLVDRVRRRIVSNESSDIMRMLNALDLPGCTDVDLVPPELEAQIDRLNEQVSVFVACRTLRPCHDLACHTRWHDKPAPPFPLESSVEPLFTVHSTQYTM
jgi:hypothetical protein